MFRCVTHTHTDTHTHTPAFMDWQFEGRENSTLQTSERLKGSACC